MALKFLERFVSALLGEPIEMYESEPAKETSSGAETRFSIYGLKAYSPKPQPAALSPEFFGVHAYRPEHHGEKPNAILAPEFHGLAAYKPAAVEAVAPVAVPDLHGTIGALYPSRAKAPAKKPAAPKAGKPVKFYGEESYTPAAVPKKISTPAPAPDATKAENEPTELDAVQKLVVENPAMTGAALIQTLKAMGVQFIDLKAAIGKPDPNAPSIEQQIQDILLKAPDISGQSLMAAMTAAQIVVKPGKPEKAAKKAEESDSVTTAPAVLRAKGKKKAGKKEASATAYTVVDSRFLEASRDDGIGPTKFKVALIQEGLGNLRDCYYYTRECLESAVATAAFEGRKCFADHPSASEEHDRPERSVRDIIGHFENVHIEETADNAARLVADLIIPHTQPFEWARTLVASAINFTKKYPDRELVGLSINASGDARPVAIEDFAKTTQLPDSVKPKLLKAMESGVKQVRVVSGIKDAVSVDLVTEPGARGKILEFIESKKGESEND